MQLYLEMQLYGATPRHPTGMPMWLPSGIAWGCLCPRRHPGGSQEAPRRHPGGTQETPRAPRAPEGSWTQKVIHLSAKMQKFPENVDFARVL